MPAFLDEPLDRADALRADAIVLGGMLARPDARVLPFWRGDPYVAGAGVVPAFAGPEAPQADGLTVFLGLDGAIPVFARALQGSRPPTDQVSALGPGAFRDLRGAVGAMSARDASIVGTARSLLSWHERHGFCARCGSPTTPTLGGWKRGCESCGAEHFPRVDPVVIMRIEHRDALLLGRSAGWPAGMWSCLAGYVEPGETIEAATSREVWEESGVRVREVRYVASQPWPFPSSLMVGVACTAEGTSVCVNAAELEEAAWFDRAACRAMVEGTHPECAIPPPAAIAHHLIGGWVG
jgi:NAD+ diphosphatase